MIKFFLMIGLQGWLRTTTDNYVTQTLLMIYRDHYPSSCLGNCPRCNTRCKATVAHQTCLPFYLVPVDQRPTKKDSICEIEYVIAMEFVGAALVVHPKLITIL